MANYRYGFLHLLEGLNNCLEMPIQDWKRRRKFIAMLTNPKDLQFFTGCLTKVYVEYSIEISWTACKSSGTIEIAQLPSALRPDFLHVR
jgi:hypothetical protein